MDTIEILSNLYPEKIHNKIYKTKLLAAPETEWPHEENSDMRMKEGTVLSMRMHTVGCIVLPWLLIPN